MTDYEKLTKAELIEKIKRLESDNTHKNIVDNLKVGLWRLGADGKTDFANELMCEMLGYSLEETLGKHLFDFMDEEMVGEAKKKLSDRKEGVSEQHEFRFLRKDGSVLFAELSTSPIFDENGEYAGALAAVFDMTEKYEYRDRLESSERKYRFLIENLNKMLFKIDETGHCLYVSGNSKEHFGYEPSELIGRHFNDIIFEDHIAAAQKALEDALKGKSAQLEYKLYKKTGEICWAEVDVSSLEEDGKIVAIGLASNMDDTIKERNKIAESEAFLNQLLQNAGVGVFSVDVIDENHFAIESINRALDNFAARSGMTADRMRKWIERDQKEKIRECYKSKAPLEYETSATYGGAERWLHISLSPIFDSVGEVDKIVGAAMDVSSRKIIENERAASEKKFRALFELAPDPIYINDLKGNFLDGNRAAEKILGFTREELVGSNFLKLDIFPAKYFPLAASNLAKHALGVPTGPDEFTLIRKDSSKVSVEVTATPVNLGGRKVVIGAVRDLTERKKMTRELEDKNKFLKALLDTAPVPIFYKDKNFRYIDCNDAFVEYLGVEKKEIVGQTVFDCWSEENAVEYHEADLKLLSSEGSLSHKSTIESKFGRKYDVIIYKSVFYDAFDNPAGILGSFVDITDFLETEKKLTEALKAKDKFFSIISHDLISPLNGFLGLTRTLLDDFGVLTLKDVKDITSALNESAQNLYKLIENLLEWSRIQSNRIKIKTEIFNISKVVDTNIRLFNANIEKKGVVVKNLVDKDVEALADKNMIDATIRNLIANALKFIGKNGVIEIKNEPAENGFVSISVADSGVGIAPEVMDKLFKIEEKISVVGEDGEKGAGLGLILCKEFVEMNGGKIYVQSIPGEGAEVSFTLPRG